MNNKSIEQKILKIVQDSKRSTALANQTSNLFLDLGFDSLAFIKLLVSIENSFSITFDFSEMENCLNVGKLVSLVEQKLKEKNGVSTAIEKPKKVK